ncbi:capsid protein [Chicken circovirus 5]|nr:capsid protein [Chicken circovirus 5]
MAGKRRRMPIRRKRRSTRRAGRKTYKRRRTSISRAPRGWKPFGNSRIARLTYCDNVTLDPGANVVAGRVFRANGLFDPDVALGGHQPYGFDQLMSIYNRFVVLGSKITVTAVPANNFGSFIIAVKLSDVAAITSTTPAVLQEQPGYRYRLCTNGLQGMTPRMTQTYSARRMCRPGFMYNDQYCGTVNNDPNDQWFFMCLLLLLFLQSITLL